MVVDVLMIPFPLPETREGRRCMCASVCVRAHLFLFHLQ